MTPGPNYWLVTLEHEVAGANDRQTYVIDVHPMEELMNYWRAHCARTVLLLALPITLEQYVRFNGPEIR